MVGDFIGFLKDKLGDFGQALDAATDQSRAAQGLPPIERPTFNSPGDFLGYASKQMGVTGLGEIAGNELTKGPSDIQAGVASGNPLQTAWGGIQTALSPITTLGKVTTEYGFGSLANRIASGKPTDPSNPQAAVDAFQRMPLGLQMLAYIASPFSKVGSLAETPQVVEGAASSGLPAIKMVAQGAASKALGLATDNPISQIETAYAKYNPLNLAFTGAGKVLDRLFQMTPMGKGLLVADKQNAVLNAFGQLLRNAGVDMSPDEFYGQLRLVQSKDSDAQQAAALRVNDAEEKRNLSTLVRPVGVRITV